MTQTSSAPIIVITLERLLAFHAICTEFGADTEPYFSFPATGFRVYQLHRFEITDPITTWIALHHPDWIVRPGDLESATIRWGQA
jgi:hypothetical protein